MHDCFGWGLLKSIELDVVKVAGTVQVALLISHYLLKQVVTTRLSLFLFKEKVIS